MFDKQYFLFAYKGYKINILNKITNNKTNDV